MNTLVSGPEKRWPRKTWTQNCTWSERRSVLKSSKLVTIKWPTNKIIALSNSVKKKKRKCQERLMNKWGFKLNGLSYVEVSFPGYKTDNTTTFLNGATKTVYFNFVHGFLNHP